MHFRVKCNRCSVEGCILVGTGNAEITLSVKFNFWSKKSRLKNRRFWNIACNNICKNHCTFIHCAAAVEPVFLKSPHACSFYKSSGSGRKNFYSRSCNISFLCTFTAARIFTDTLFFKQKKFIFCYRTEFNFVTGPEKNFRISKNIVRLYIRAANNLPASRTVHRVNACLSSSDGNTSRRNFYAWNFKSRCFKPFIHSDKIGKARKKTQHVNGINRGRVCRNNFFF